MKRLWLYGVLAAAVSSAHAQPAANPPVPAPGAAHPAVITNPVWVRLPSGDELATYYPRGAHTTGLVRMECDITAKGELMGCVAVSESPAGEGFGAAAVKMSRLFRMSPETRNGVPVGGATVVIPIQFTYGVSPPRWLGPPTPEEEQSVWPTGAPDKGVAQLDCEVTSKGHARHCSVISETPAHSGFGKAAIKLSPSFRLTPPKLQGNQPTEADAQLTIPFEKPQPKQVGTGEYGPITSLHNAPWQAAPTTADMAAAWPAAAPANVGEAKVRVQCGFSPDTFLTGCRLLSEDPAGYGFGAAAIKLTGKFRTRGAIMDDAMLAKAWLFLSFEFLNPKSVGAEPVWLTKPNWVSFIPEGRMTELYPTAAVQAGIKTGRGVVTCTVAPDGSLTACALESEDPPGKGFGQAALAAITYFAVDPWTDDGRPADGSKIRVPIRFNEEEPEPTPAAKGAP